MSLSIDLDNAHFMAAVRAERLERQRVRWLTRARRDYAQAVNRIHAAYTTVLNMIDATYACLPWWTEGIQTARTVSQINAMIVYSNAMQDAGRKLECEERQIREAIESMSRVNAWIYSMDLRAVML